MVDHQEKTKPETMSPSSSDFEFGSLTPSSPSQDQENSPADHLFLNGRLLPHTFPMTRTTSESTFRSNSTSSRSSDSSSPTSYTPRTSTCNSVFKVTSSNITCFGPRSEEIMDQRSRACDKKEYYRSHHKPSTNMSGGEKTSLTCFGPGSEKIMDSNKDYYQTHHKPASLLKKRPQTNNGKVENTTRRKKISYMPTQCKRKKATEIVTAQLYGSYTRQWQHITPVFKREGSVKSSTKGEGFKVGGGMKKKKMAKKVEERTQRSGSKLMKWLKKVLKTVVLACRECHAMEPQRVVEDHDTHVKKKITKCP